MRHRTCSTIFSCSFIICGLLAIGGTLQPRNLPNLPPPPPPEQCPRELDLTPETWNKLKMDEYIASIPDIDKMNLAEFSRKIGAANFFCGIGLSCNAGQLCSPVAGKNWLILVAIQHWNSYMNAAYQAISNAITIVRDASAELITDFIPDTVMDNSIYGWAIATLVLGVLAAFTAVLTPILCVAPEIEAIPAYGKAGTIASMAAANFEKAQQARYARDVVGIWQAKQAEDTRVIAVAAKEALEAKKPLPPLKPATTVADVSAAIPLVPGGVVISHRKRSTSDENHGMNNQKTPLLYNVNPSDDPSQSMRLQKRKGPPPSAFAYQRYAEVDTHLAAIQNRLQKDVAGSVHAGVTLPIYNENGLASVLLGGMMFQKLPDQVALEEKHRAFAKITALNEIFKAQNMFVTLDCDPCKDSGPGGAWPQDKFLSYCTPQGSMRNIIRAEGIHARNEVRNAALLLGKYGFSTESLTQKAIDCQTKYGFYKPGGKAPEPKDAEAECVFNIPVCDCKVDVIHKKKHKKKGTVRACRAAGVPI
ncbi:hypothetical protein PtA15_9A220 [Puccinia triticina]|uniref:DUF7872 domain-containing protein n=1 Tax=Puccinia triticina TaxID=208348 RepID=A0ABY7CTV1_9BASI|nr:uncharacterized protein PtA15_9A220 [Puccinia triticina]WAQ88095.1 hypothetical protein PtA15_9A220 [Puccinia triticina]